MNNDRLEKISNRLDKVSNHLSKSRADVDTCFAIGALAEAVRELYAIAHIQANATPNPINYGHPLMCNCATCRQTSERIPV